MVKQIKTKEQLDSMMLEIAKSTSGIQKAEASFQEKLDKITAEREKVTSPLLSLKEKAEAAVTDYVFANRSELYPGESKTLKTPYGTISFKLTKEKVVFESESVVISNMKKHWFKYMFDKNYRAAVKVEYKLVKEVLKNMPDADLLKIGVSKSTEERVYITPDLEMLNKQTKKPVLAIENN